MHNNRKNADYAPLRRKIFRQTLLMMFAAIVGVWALYAIVLQGRFANFLVWVLQNITNMDYQEAVSFYWDHIRDYFDIIMLSAMALAFFVMFHFFLDWFTRYFQEIDDSINILVRRDGSKIRMSREMEAMEFKLNSVSETIERQFEEIQMAEKKKDEMVLYLAHDIRTPLTSVIGYLTLLEEMPDLTREQQDKFIHVTLDKANRLEVLVNEFFDITRFSRHEIDFARTEIDLYYMLAQLADEVYPLVSPEGKTVVVSADENCIIYGDGDKLARIFNNILKNAISYSKPESEIRIEAKEEENETVICFTNWGQTISGKEQELIFDKFYRRDEARQTNNGGAGLGLAIAKELVEMHNGTIGVESSEGKTTFTVRIPKVSS